ncbi:hypothetical protein [Clostridium sp. C8-1-8]|uniref:hypothetical protein n=1 Tax=Clostridium sp. C8-1-8 TaxID=2698831 RepID=UPI0013684647|nr:hypothetical protein [Clostridium sp. C8-1-8]
MIDYTEYFLKFLLGAIFFGYVYSQIEYSFLEIHIPIWLNRALFYVRENKKVSLIAVVWQIGVYILYTILFISLKVSTYKYQINIINSFQDKFMYFFWIFALLRLIDTIAYIIINKKN